jgi:hypothetical protein
MTAQVKDLTTDAGKFGEESTFAELRQSVDEIAKVLSVVAERRTRAAKEAALAGTSAVRGSIRRQPVLAMGIAAVAGAVLAVTVVPRFGRRRRSEGWAAWAPSIPVTRAELHDVADGIRRSVAQATSAVPLTSSFERLVEALTKAEPSASLNSAIEKAGTWFQKLQARASQKSS